MVENWYGYTILILLVIWETVFLQCSILIFFLCEICQTLICLPWAVLYVVPGTSVYDKLGETLTENSLVKGIKQASPFSQTSSLEGFHSALNYFAPKIIAYSYVGMYYS